jgi:hypothetical protein
MGSDLDFLVFLNALTEVREHRIDIAAVKNEKIEI